MIRRGVFCVHKPGFLMPGHIYGSYSTTIILDLPQLIINFKINVVA